MAENRIGGLAEFGILGNSLADIEKMSRENGNYLFREESQNINKNICLKEN